MFSRTMQAIQRNQMLFIAVFSVTLCAGIGIQSAAKSREQLAVYEARVAAEAEAAARKAQSEQGVVRESPLFFAMPPPASAGSTDYFYCDAAVMGEIPEVNSVWVQIKDPLTIIDGSDTISITRYSDDVFTAPPPPTPPVFQGIGALAFLGWALGAACLALMCVALADRKYSPPA